MVIVLRVNNAPYITKKNRKAIMKRSKLQKTYRKTLTEKSLKVYRTKKDHASRLYKRNVL